MKVWTSSFLWWFWLLFSFLLLLLFLLFFFGLFIRIYLSCFCLFWFLLFLFLFLWFGITFSWSSWFLFIFLFFCCLYLCKLFELWFGRFTLTNIWKRHKKSKICYQFIQTRKVLNMINPSKCITQFHFLKIHQLLEVWCNIQASNYICSRNIWSN